MSQPSRHLAAGRVPAVFGLLLLTMITLQCRQKPVATVADPAYARYVEAYSSGTISRASVIRLRLAQETGMAHVLNEPVQGELFKFSPQVPGKAYWTDDRTIEFKPDQPLKPDQVYQVEFALGKVSTVPEAFKTFRFAVQTIKPQFILHEQGLRSAGNARDKMSFSGYLETADLEDGASVEKILTLTLNGKEVQASWAYNEAQHLHHFTLPNVDRLPTAGKLTIAWDGRPIGSAATGKMDLEVPAVGDFKVLTVRAVQESENYVLVQFSDPLAAQQDLRGLITVANKPDPVFVVQGSEVKVYPGEDLDGNYSVSVNPGVENLWQQKLTVTYSAAATFENRLPSVAILGQGSILPNTGRLVLPFTAVNLRSVDISIIRIYEQNIPQFLQTNAIDGDDQLRRVAAPVVQATLPLDGDKGLDLHKRQSFTLDIDKYLRTEPGAIYRVTIGFRPEYSVYPCGIDTTKKKTKVADDEEAEEEDEDDYAYRAAWRDDGSGVDSDEAFWNRYDDYYPFGYNWRRRNDPCHRSYYSKDRWASRNVMASNIGLIAKWGGSGKLLVAATDILTTVPLENVELRVLDYQQQLIGTGTSNGEGLVTVECKRKPFLLVARKGVERGYLKLDDGGSLPLSRFDVDGEQVQKGIKVFLYGERGVWRPGDSIYLTCMVNDRANPLPEGHPVQFDLLDPQGQGVRRTISTKGMNGMYRFATATSPEAPTGNWTARVRVGGAVFEKRVRIETVMPNRLKIDLDLGGDSVLGKGARTSAQLASNWLFGAPANGLKAKVDATLNARTTVFPKFKRYTFDNPATRFEQVRKTVFDGTLNAEGTAPVPLAFDPGKNAPGMLNASFQVKVFEPGGAFSIDNLTLPYSPYSSYAGVFVPEGPKPWGFLMTGKAYRTDLVRVDAKGAPVQGPSTLEVELYKVQWRWWWDESGDDIGDFTQGNSRNLVRKEKVELRDGSGGWEMSVPSGEWGRYLLLVKDPESGHVTGRTVYFDDPWWQTRTGNEPSAASMLSFTSDKEKYEVGEQVKLTIPSSEGGRALISLESGSRVIRTYWTTTKKGQTEFSFPAEAGMSPNIYANVTLLQPHGRTNNDLPIRMYGVIPVTIEDKSTVLRPQIAMPVSLEPEKAATISVSEATGKAMTYTLAIVDEGLLDLTRFATPDPHAAFHAREALGVKSWDLFDDVLGARAAGIDRILTIGGDQGLQAGKRDQKANRFKPVVSFLGPFTLGAGQKANHTLTLPPYIGSVRVMVVAGQDGRYGSADKTVPVKKPLMILATLPRVLGPGETTTVPVTVFSSGAGIRNVRVDLQADPHFEVVGSPSQNVVFDRPGEQQVRFTVKVKAATGVGKVKVQASGNSIHSSTQMELDIRNPNPVVTQVKEWTVNPGGSVRFAASPVGEAVSSTAVLEVSSLPPMDLSRRMDYLVTYPHGCVEQTTSAVFPQLYLVQLTDMDARKKAETERNIRAGIEKLSLFRRPDGGFSYWPGETKSDEWGTSYAGHFLLEALQKGYAVPDDLLQGWKSFQRARATAWAPSTTQFYGADLEQAYRLYLLALARSPEIGAMNRLREFPYLSAEAKWQLAAAYQLAGQGATAKAMVSGLPRSFPVRTSFGQTYGSDLRDQAMVLNTLTVMGDRTNGAELARTIAARLTKDDWYSTQTTAWSLMSIARWSGANPSGEKIDAEVTVNGKAQQLNGASYLNTVAVPVQSGQPEVRIVNRGKAMLYVRLIGTGRPPAGTVIPVTNDPGKLGVTVSYQTPAGKPVDIASIPAGTDLVARVTIRNPGKTGDQRQMALSQIFPSGWEILNTRLAGVTASGTSPFTWQDIRDDRVYTYFNIRAGESLTYAVTVTAAYAGRYFLPGTYCESMYDRTISGGVAGRWVEVK